MKSRIVVAVVVVGMLGLVLVTFGGAVMPESTHNKPTSPSRSLSSSRFLMLLPDGKVEVTDAWARRLYQWDGRTWVELEVTRIPTPGEVR
jgi:hypothetical protein